MPERTAFPRGALDRLRGEEQSGRMNTTTQQELQAALEAQGFEVLQGKGGFWLRGHGHVTTAKARQMTGLAAPKRVYREKIMYGEYAEMVAFVNRSR